MTRNELNASLMEDILDAQHDFETAAKRLDDCYGIPDLANFWTGMEIGRKSNRNAICPLGSMTADEADQVAFMIEDILNGLKKVHQHASEWAIAKRAYENRMDYECEGD